MFSYWNILDRGGLHVEISDYILYAGHIVMCILCQVLLFVPKVWPPLREKLLSIASTIASY